MQNTFLFGLKSYVLVMCKVGSRTGAFERAVPVERIFLGFLTDSAVNLMCWLCAARRHVGRKFAIIGDVVSNSQLWHKVIDPPRDIRDGVAGR